MVKIDEELVVNLNGPDGNAFCIMGNVAHIMRQHGCSKEEVDEYTKAAMSSDYDNLLKVSGQVVNLVLV